MSYFPITKDKKTTSRQVEEAETWSHENPAPSTETRNRKGSHRPGDLEVGQVSVLEKQSKGWVPHISNPWDQHQTDGPLKHLAYKTNGTYVQGTQSCKKPRFPLLTCGLTSKNPAKI